MGGGPAALARLGRPAPLPHRARLEGTFGTALEGVTVRVGADAQMRELGAGAATLGDVVVFGNEAPSLHEVAHEVTHVLQNRGAGSAAGRAVSAPHDAAEREAESAGQAAAAGGTVEVSEAPAGALQRGPLDWLKKKKPSTAKSDADVVAGGYQQGDGGSLNRVDRVDYATPIGGASTRGYFKADTAQTQGNSARAVAASRLDRKLGFNQLSAEEFATHGGEQGSVSADLGPGHQPLMYNNFGAVAPDQNAKASPYNKRIGGVLHDLTTQDRVAHDFSNPVTQKTLADLQLQDAITGQKDRHGGNIYIDTATGRAKGIDNDQAFDKGEDHSGYRKQYLDDPGGFYAGLPQQVDAQSAKAVLKMKSSTFKKTIKGSSSDPARMDKTSVKEATKRFKDVKSHVKGLKKQGLLVDNWDATTHAAAMSNTHASYLKTAQSDLALATGGTDARERRRELDGTITPPPVAAAPVAAAPVAAAPVAAAPVAAPTIAPSLAPTRPLPPVPAAPVRMPGLPAQRSKLTSSLPSSGVSSPMSSATPRARLRRSAGAAL